MYYFFIMKNKMGGITTIVTTLTIIIITMATSTDAAVSNCPTGTFSQGAAATVCTLCPQQSYINTNNVCQTCDAGKYNTAAGSLDCQMLCPPGLFGNCFLPITISSSDVLYSADATHWSCSIFLSPLNTNKAWCASDNDNIGMHYLMLSTPTVGYITGITTQGRYDWPQWVTSYNVSYSTDNITWTFFNTTFRGNTDQNTGVTNALNVWARHIKITPIAFNGWISMRAGLTTASGICGAGTYSTTWGAVDSGSCVGCSAGKYSTASSLSAASCPYTCTSSSSYATAIGTTSMEDCGIPCRNGGSFFKTLTRACVPCSASSYCGIGGGCIDACIACPSHTKPSANETTCVSGACFVCPSGGYCDGSLTFFPCPLGTASSAMGQSLPTTCASCGPGAYASSTGTTACSLCLPGTFSSLLALRSQACALCGIGSFASGMGATAVSPSIKGTYVSSMGSSSAIPCGGGSYTDTMGASVCQLCPSKLAFFGNISAWGAPSFEVACLAIPCPLPNSLTAKAGSCKAEDCVCNAGYFFNNNNGSGGGTNKECLACPWGSYAPAINTSACLACPANTYDAGGSLQPRDTVCGPVAANCYAPPSSITFYANAGYYRDLVTMQCRPCPIGTFSNNNGGGCISCGAGTTSQIATQKASDCRCTDGFILNLSSSISSVCSTLCPIGSFCMQGNVYACSSNAQTFFAGAASPAACQCVAGYYSASILTAVIGGSVVGCQQCDAGFVCPGIMNNTNNNNNSGSIKANAADRIQCPINTFSKPGSIKIASDCVCKPGFMPTAGGGCVLCPLNTFCSSGQVTACGNNSIAPSGASSSANCTCIGGFFGYNNNKTDCSNVCPMDSYCFDGKKQSCPPNASTGGLNQRYSPDACRCIAGFFPDAAQWCTPCPINRLLFFIIAIIIIIYFVTA